MRPTEAPGLALLNPKVYGSLPHIAICPVKRGGHMAKKLLTLLFTSVLALPLATAVFAQEAPAQAKATKEARWDGTVIRSSKDQSTLTVRKRGGTAEIT